MVRARGLDIFPLTAQDPASFPSEGTISSFNLNVSNQ